MRFLEAKDRTLANILSENRFKIDSFQREYRWQRKQIEALISDLATAFNKSYVEGDTIETYEDYGSYYMGPIVLCDDRGEFSIVDGQQRLTSFTLLLIYLLHAQDNLKIEKDIQADINKHLYIRKKGKDTLILNVESRAKVMEHLIANPGTVFQDIVQLEENADSIQKSKDESIQNIIERYEDIDTFFPEDLYDSTKLPIFIEWLLHHVILVEIKAFSMESAYTIFETMNDRGLSLNPTEILKGYLLSMIENDEKGEEMNDFWKEKIFDIKSAIGADGDLEFFRNWLRAKYAETKRSTAKGSENLDFEQIGTQFHSWVKNNTTKIFLKKSDDFYFFIKSDFDFFSNVYIDLYEHKKQCCQGFEKIYVGNFYSIADSLAYPLYLAPISKIDDENVVAAKIHTVNNFIDCYTVLRTFQNKTVTQSSIRNSIYELVKDIRNVTPPELVSILHSKLNEVAGSPDSAFDALHNMNNWGFYHYFFARILYNVNAMESGFETLLRSKKQNSYILTPIIPWEEANETTDDALYYKRIESVANYVLIRRYDIEKFNGLHLSKRLKFLKKGKYIPEIDFDFDENNLNEFIERRDQILKNLVDRIWRF